MTDVECSNKTVMRHVGAPLLPQDSLCVFPHPPEQETEKYRDKNLWWVGGEVGRSRTRGCSARPQGGHAAIEQAVWGAEGAQGGLWRRRHAEGFVAEEHDLDWEDMENQRRAFEGRQEPSS